MAVCDFVWTIEVLILQIDDMLDQLEEMKYFRLGLWVIHISRTSREKTALVKQHGLFEFRVMPFGLTNAPAVFLHLMQQVIGVLNPLEGPSFVSVYIDDLVYSKTRGATPAFRHGHG